MRKCGQALPDWVDSLPNRQKATVKSLHRMGWNVSKHLVALDRVEMTYQGWGGIDTAYVFTSGDVWK